MFNQAFAGPQKFSSKKVLAYKPDQSITLFAGPDPADSDRVLIRKIVQINLHTYAYEETHINRATGSSVPSVHKTITKIHGFDLKEELSNQERQIRMAHRPMPNILGFSLYWKPLSPATFFSSLSKNIMWAHFSIVENTLWKSNGQTWQGWWSTWKDRRDMSWHLARSI